MSKRPTNSRAPWRRVAVVLAICMATGLAGAGTAGATMFEKVTSYSGGDNAAFEQCGLAIDWQVEYSGKYAIREGKGKQAGAFFLRDNYSAVETFTNTANGKYATLSHNGVYQDLKATRVDGTIFEFVSHEVGQPWVVRDMDGRVVLRDRGSITFTYLFDVGDDFVPGGEDVALLDIRVAGPHPGFFISEEESCAGLVSLIG